MQRMVLVRRSTQGPASIKMIQITLHSAEECIVQDDAYIGDFYISDMYEVSRWFVKQKDQM